MWNRRVIGVIGFAVLCVALIGLSPLGVMFRSI